MVSNGRSITARSSVQKNTQHATRSDILIRLCQDPSHILELAKRGAEHRIQELKAELALLVRQFPHLREGLANRLGSPAETVARPIRRRRRMSEAAKKAISERMKKVWAARRKAKAKG